MSDRALVFGRAPHDVEEHDVRRVVRRPRAGHLAVLGTVSAFLQLPEVEQVALLERIGAVLPEEVEVDATVRLHLARRIWSGVRRGSRR